MSHLTSAPKRIVFIIPHPPAVDFARKFFISELKMAGFDVLLWNVGPLMGLNLTVEPAIEGMHYERIANLRALHARILDAKSTATVFVPQLTRSGRSFGVFAVLALARVKTVFFGRGYLPFISQPRKDGRFFVRKLRRARNLGLLLRFGWEGALSRILPIVKKHDLTFIAGRIAERLHAGDSEQMVPIHHFDIDCMHGQKSVRLIDERYCVFLDDYLPYHPDFDIGNVGHIHAGSYYAALNEFFSWAEQTLDLRIVIAAHPKAQYQENPFGGRALYVAQTQHLVRDAAFVFAHGSTAISFAVMYEKPLCLLISDAIRKVHLPEYHQMLCTVDLLECPLMDIDHDRQKDALIEAVNKDRYREFSREFLSNTDTTRTSAEIVVAEVTALSKR